MKPSDQRIGGRFGGHLAVFGLVVSYVLIAVLVLDKTWPAAIGVGLALGAGAALAERYAPRIDPQAGDPQAASPKLLIVGAGALLAVVLVLLAVIGRG